MKKNNIVISISIVGAVLLSGCSTKTQYDDINGQDTTNVGFNLTDLRATTEKMVDELLDAKAIKRITAVDRPTLFFSNIRNETHEHLNTSMLANTVQTKLIKSDIFQFTDMSQIKDIKEQAGYQNDSGMVDQDTAIKLGKQVGAKYMLYGAFQDIDQTGKKGFSNVHSKAYVITLKMIDLETGIVIWQEDKQIRKSQTQSFFGL
jgi:uncharacterized protein (TIGR02722 family)